MKRSIVLLALLFWVIIPPCAAQSLANYQKLIHLKKGFKVYKYPNSNFQKLASLTIMDPGFPVVPLNGGLFVPGVNTWLINPSFKMPILSSSFLMTDRDTAMLLLKLDRARKKIVVQKTTYLNNPDSAKSLFSMPINKYDLCTMSSRNFFIWGRIEGGAALWKSDYENVSSIFYTGSEIRDMDYINDDNYVVALDSSLVGIGMKKVPEVIFTFDYPIESISIDRHITGAIYISTPSGIVRLNSVESDDLDVITERIHGKIKIFQNKLFVLWAEQSQVVEILLK